ncbi:MAG: DHA2 family efflux MFS transporter permease subunit [Rhodobacteraceae bacterium]|nr:DHA2 family efflux MFS transporter permease subunit [Paracoccaceae bacterium]
MTLAPFADTGKAASRRRASESISKLLLVAGIVLAALCEAIASTVLSVARLDMSGDLYATSDEFSLLNVGYTAAKLAFFVLSPWLMYRLSAQTCIRAATGLLTISCGLAALTSDLDFQIALRLFQGMTGGVVLVCGQTILLTAFNKNDQPIIQAVFAMGAVVAPTTLAPSVQGWLVETLSWDWVFLLIVPTGVVSTLCLSLVRIEDDTTSIGNGFDWVGFSLFGAAAFCLTFVLGQGNRWDWLEEPFIVNLILLGCSALVLFALHQGRSQATTALLDLSVFRNQDFAFGFLASFAAGFALFGSAYVIPSFAVSILKMTATEAGLLLLPSSGMFVCSLFLTAFLVRKVNLPPVITVPLGILIFMTTMWMLSGSNADSGPQDMMPAILLRGLGLGFLFLSITLITLVGLPNSIAAHGVALFNVGRQMGGLLGVAFLETLIHNQTALNKTILASHLLPGRIEVSERLASLTSLLIARGVEASTASRAAIRMIGQELVYQASVIAFDTAFMTIAFFFCVAAPVLVVSKIFISKISSGNLDNT